MLYTVCWPIPYLNNTLTTDATVCDTTSITTPGLQPYMIYEVFVSQGLLHKCSMYIQYTTQIKLRILNILNFLVVDICYTFTHSIHVYELHKKVKDI